MNEQSRKEIEEGVKDIDILVKQLFAERFKAQFIKQINNYEWLVLVRDQDHNKQFIMVFTILEDSSLEINYHTIEDDLPRDIEQSVRAVHHKMKVILKDSKVFKIPELEVL